MQKKTHNYNQTNSKIICITGESALYFWLNSNDAINRDTFSLENRVLVNFPQEFVIVPNRIEADEISTRLHLPLPLNCMVSHNVWRNNNEKMNFVCCPKNLPPRSFVKINNEIFIASPEYAFLSVAFKTDFVSLVELANSLCAIYVYDKHSVLLQQKREPITSILTIEKYLSKCSGLKGVRLAQRAIKYAVDNSNSPIESKLATIMRIPKSEGGYCYKDFFMNEFVKLSPDGAALVHCDGIRVDFNWKKEKVAVEYDSNQTHLEVNQHAFDKNRVNALTTSGYKVITITVRHIQSLNELDNIMETLRKALNLHDRKSTLEVFHCKRLEIFKKLFHSHSNLYHIE